jgi:hypothetical protein
LSSWMVKIQAERLCLSYYKHCEALVPASIIVTSPSLLLLFLLYRVYQTANTMVEWKVVATPLEFWNDLITWGKYT